MRVAQTLAQYRLTEVTGDRYAAGFVVDAMARVGIAYRHSDRDRSAIYADAMPLFTSGRARLLDNQKLIAQLANLERKTSVGGRDRIDHPRGAHDDCANAVAGALTLAPRRVAGSGWLEFMKWSAGHSNDEPPKGPMVRLLAPPGVSHVQVLSGKEIAVPNDRIIQVTEDDARPLIGAGFKRLSPEQEPPWP